MNICHHLWVQFLLLTVYIRQKRKKAHEDALAASVHITHRMVVAAHEIGPQGVFPDVRWLSQTPGGLPVTSAQQLFTLILQVVCKEEHRNVPWAEDFKQTLAHLQSKLNLGHSTTLSLPVLTRPMVLGCFGLAAKKFRLSVTAIVPVATPTEKSEEKLPLARYYYSEGWAPPGGGQESSGWSRHTTAILKAGQNHHMGFHNR